MKIKEGEKDFLRERNNLLSSRLQMKSFNDDAKYKDVLQDLDERLDVIEENLQVLREQRFEIKNILETVNKFSDEGIQPLLLTFHVFVLYRTMLNVICPKYFEFPDVVQGGDFFSSYIQN